MTKRKSETTVTSSVKRRQLLSPTGQRVPLSQSEQGAQYQSEEEKIKEEQKEGVREPEEKAPADSNRGPPVLITGGEREQIGSPLHASMQHD